jgi:hypothetical protein
MARFVCGGEICLWRPTGAIDVFETSADVAAALSGEAAYMAMSPGEPPARSRNAYLPLSTRSFPVGQSAERNLSMAKFPDADFEVSTTAVAVAITINVAGTNTGAV